MKKVTRGIERLIAHILIASANSLPESDALRLGAAMGSFARFLLRRRVRIIYENLRLCGIAYGIAKRRLFAHRVFQHLGVTAIEVLRQRCYTTDDFHRKITADDLDQLEMAAVKGKGVLLLSGHFGNWELLGSFVRNLGYPVDLLVKRQSDERADELMNSMRRAQGVGIIFTDTGMKDLVSAVKSGRFVAVLADQYGGADSETVKFFGLDTSVPSGPAILIQRYGLPFVFGTMRRARNGRHFLTAQAIVDMSRKDRAEVVQIYTSMLEKAIRQSPEMWLWTHRKFKNLTDYSETRNG